MSPKRKLKFVGENVEALLSPGVPKGCKGESGNSLRKRRLGGGGRWGGSTGAGSRSDFAHQPPLDRELRLLRFCNRPLRYATHACDIFG